MVLLPLAALPGGEAEAGGVAERLEVHRPTNEEAAVEWAVVRAET